MTGTHITRRAVLQKAAATASAPLAAGLLASCGNSSTSSSSVTTVNYWDWWVTQAIWVDDEIKRFQEAHPTIKIKKTTQVVSAYGNLLNLSMRNNSGPDVFMIPGQPSLADQVKLGWMLPLDRWATPQWRAKFPKNAFQEGSNMLNGKYYSSPLTGAAPWLQLYIHNDVFRQAGLTNADGSIQIPRTWDDVTHAAETIVKKSNGSVYGLGFGNGTFNLLPWWLELFIRGAGCPGGASGLDLRTGKYAYSSDRNYSDFISLFREWKQKGYFYSNSMSIGDEAARAFFERGKFGMTVGGVWNQPEWTQHKFTDYSLTTLVGPEATPKGYFYNSGGGNFIAISNKAKHADEAWAWFDWLYSPEAGKRFVEKGIDLSIYAQNNDAKLVKFAPFAQYVATTTKNIPGADVKARNPQTSQVDPLMKPVKPDIGDILAGVYTDQISDIAGALSTLESKSQQSLQDAIKLAHDKGYNVSSDDYVFADWDITKPYYITPRTAS